jgi:hypothetical protein
LLLGELADLLGELAHLLGECVEASLALRFVVDQAVHASVHQLYGLDQIAHLARQGEQFIQFQCALNRCAELRVGLKGCQELVLLFLAHHGLWSHRTPYLPEPAPGLISEPVFQSRSGGVDNTRLSGRGSPVRHGYRGLAGSTKFSRLAQEPYCFVPRPSLHGKLQAGQMPTLLAAKLQARAPHRDWSRGRRT